MAGSSGGAGGAAGSAAPPCCRDKTIVEFRLIEGDENRKTFGFDWLRVPQDQSVSPRITKEEDAYIASDWDGGSAVAGIVLGGYKPWTEEEQKAVTRDNPDAGHVDLTAHEAQQKMEGDFQFFYINREDSFFDYRLKSKKCYAPFLNLFPPVDYLLTEDQIKILIKGMKSNAPVGDDTKAKLKPILETKRFDASKIEGKEKWEDLTPEERLNFLEALKEFTFVDDNKGESKATLRLIKDIKVEPPKKVTIKYEHANFAVNIRGGIITKCEDQPEFSEIMIPVEYYNGVTLTIEEMRGLQVEIAALKKFGGEQTIEVWAYNKDGVPEKTLAGKMIVLPNEVTPRTNIAIVSVETDIEGRGGTGRSANCSDTEIGQLRRELHNALIMPNIVTLTLDLKNDPKFRRGTQDSFITIRGDINQYLKNFGVHVEKAFLDAHPEFKDWYLVFNFDVPTVVIGGMGNVDVCTYNPESEDDDSDGNGVKDKYKYPQVDIFRQTCFLYKGHDDVTLGHELLHAYTLRHTHSDEWPQTSAKVRYYFNHAEDVNNPREATTNIMSYNVQKYCWQTWAWQWEIMRDHVEAAPRNPEEDQSGSIEEERQVLPGTY